MLVVAMISTTNIVLQVVAILIGAAILAVMRHFKNWTRDEISKPVKKVRGQLKAHVQKDEEYWAKVDRLLSEREE